MFKLLCFGGLLLLFSAGRVLAESSERVVNGEFEDGFKGWRVTGDVHLQTNSPLVGRASAIIGPGAGSLTQRIETGSGNDFTVSALIQSESSHDWLFFLRFLDQQGQELMRVDSSSDMER